MVTKKKTKKRNPADLTSRNNNARKKEIWQLNEEVSILKGFIEGVAQIVKIRLDSLDERVSRLESKRSSK